MKLSNQKHPFMGIAPLFLVRIMKLTTALIIFSLLQVSAKGVTQTITISVKNVPLQRVFEEIHRQSGFDFIYTSLVDAKRQTVSMDVKSVKIQDVLDMCFKDLPYKYYVDGKNVVVSIKKNFSNETDIFKLIDVKGRISNERDEPLSNVSVVVRGTKKVSITDEMGLYSLFNIDENSTLLISSVGYERQEIKINGRGEINFQLKILVTKLDTTNVIINTGYQIIPKERTTGSYTFLNKDQLDKRLSTDIISRLEGITNGLVFNKDPLNNGAPKIRIRGESTIFANPSPLIVVDNFPYDGDINNINPNDVENITILKDAAAASIWGVQAGNGVIVITTKKGKYGKPLQCEFNTNMVIGEKPNLLYNNKITSSNYIDFEEFLFDKGYYNSTINSTSYIAISPVVEILNNKRLGKISNEEANTQINTLKKQDIKNDFNKYIYKYSLLQQYQLNFSGGSEKNSYYFSTGYDKDITNVVGNTNSRITLNLQDNFKVFKGLDVRLASVFTQLRNINNGITNIPNIYPYTKIVGENGEYLSIAQHRSVFEDTIENRGFKNWKYKPLEERDFIDNKSNTYDIRLSAAVKYNIFKGLNIDLSYQYERSINNGKALTDENSYTIRNLSNSFAILDSKRYKIGSNYPAGGQLSLTSNNLTGHYGRFGADYNRLWADHSVSAIVGFEVREVLTESNSSLFYGYDKSTGTFVNPDLYKSYTQYPIGTAYIGGTPGLSGLAYSSTINRFRSYFGNASYTYRGKYTFSLSGRLDGSNYFGVNANKKTVPLWSIGGKWNISREKFYSSHVIPNLNLRVTYGYNGNLAQNLAAITTLKYLTFPDYNTGLPYSKINNIPNPNLRWEKTGQLNVGLDFSSYNNIISGSFEYYHKNGQDLIGDAKIDYTTGISIIRGNFSAMKSKGVDLVITSKNIDREIHWESTIIFNYTSEKVTEYNVPPGGVTFLNAFSGGNGTAIPVVGKPLFSLFSYRWAGLDPNNGDPRVYNSDTITKLYDNSIFKYSDFVYNGRFNPSIFGSLRNSLTYKGFGLDINLTYKFNYYFRRSSINYNNLAGTNGWQQAQSDDYSLRWRNKGDETHTNVPSLIYPFNITKSQYYLNSDVLVEKGDYIKFQYVNLNYNFNRGKFRKLPFESLKIYVYANNVAILWKANKANLDPDYPYSSYPPTKTYAIGLKAIF